MFLATNFIIEILTNLPMQVTHKQLSRAQSGPPDFAIALWGTVSE